MRRSVIAIIGIIVIVIAAFAVIQVFLEPSLSVGYAVRVQGNYAYVTDNTGVVILDVSEPSRSRRVGNIAFADGAYGIHVRNDLAFIAADSEGFVIVDISDPTNPVKLGGYNDGGSAYEVCVDGAYAYITKLNTGLQILDISNPEVIYKVGELNGLGRGDDVEVHQGIVYYADGSGDSLKIINTTDPSTPQKIKDLNGISGIYDIYIYEDENLLFLACHSIGVRILNISNPQSPSVISSYLKTEGETYGISGNSTHLYVADLQQGAYMLDITNPSSPVEITSYSNAAPHGIFIDGGYIYLADQNNGLIILDSELMPVYGGYAATPGFNLPVIITGLFLFLIINKWRKRKRKLL